MPFDKTPVTHWKMTWQEVEDVCTKLARNIRRRQKEEFQPKRIVGIAKGGLIPAALLWYHFPNTNFTVLKVSSYTDVFKRTTPLIELPYNWDRDIWNQPDTLVVDDICDTGNTFRALVEYLPRANYAAMLVRDREDQFEYDYLGEAVTGDVWVDFPWERKED